MIPRFGEKKGEIMTLHKQDISRASLEKGYEENVVGVRGVVAFGVGLFLLIVITFWLMWALHGVLEERAKETKSSDNPMAMNDRERLARAEIARSTGIWRGYPKRARESRIDCAAVRVSGAGKRVEGAYRKRCTRSEIGSRYRFTDRGS
ncbi:MAG: hypothetical protein C4325_07985 [Blastocatellia bacterium]